MNQHGSLPQKCSALKIIAPPREHEKHSLANLKKPNTYSPLQKFNVDLSEKHLHVVMEVLACRFELQDDVFNCLVEF